MVGLKRKARLVGMTKEENSVNDNSAGPETESRLAGMTKEENADYVDKTEPERKSFAASPHLKALQSHRLRIAFPCRLGWNGKGRVFEQC